MFICCTYIGWSIVPFVMLISAALYRPVMHLMVDGADLYRRVNEPYTLTAPEAVIKAVIAEAFPEAIHGNPFVVCEKSTSLGAWYPTLAAKGM